MVGNQVWCYESMRLIANSTDIAYEMRTRVSLRYWTVFDFLRKNPHIRNSSSYAASSLASQDSAIRTYYDIMHLY